MLTKPTAKKPPKVEVPDPPVGLLARPAKPETDQPVVWLITANPERESLWPHLAVRKALVAKQLSKDTVKLQLYDNNFIHAIPTSETVIVKRSEVLPDLVLAYNALLQAWKAKLEEARRWMMLMRRAGKVVPEYVPTVVKKSTKRRRHTLQNAINHRRKLRIHDLENTDIQIAVEKPVKTNRKKVGDKRVINRPGKKRVIRL